MTNTTNYLQMTNKDITRKEILDKVISNQLTNEKAWNLLNLTKRQIIRIKKEYILNWVKWLIHKARWKTSNNNSSTSKNNSKYEEIYLLWREKYSDYNLTHFSEKLEEKHNIKISIPTLRNKLISTWLHKVRKRKIKQEFHRRERREYYWELVQYDWAYHKWLEDRNWGEELCLLVKVDDATGIVNAKFDKSEWIIPTFKFWKDEIKRTWKPRAIYLDKFATYKINHINATDDKELKTQFWRVCKTLWIQLIFANSPQWKWRVERMNGTLEDRLVKELREANICSMEEANIFLQEEFLPKFNEKFKVEAKWWKTDLHIKLRKEEIEHLEQIFSIQSTRKLKNDFTIEFKNRIYQLYRNKDWWWVHLNKGDLITVEEHLNQDWNWNTKIHISKSWRYIVFKELQEKKRKRYTLPMAPANRGHFVEMKSEIEKLGEIVKIQEENEKQKQIEKQTEVENELRENKKSYFEVHWKFHPWMKNFHLIKK